MNKNEKMKFIRLLEGSDLSISDVLAKYDIPRSTYYRWKRKLRSQGIKGLQDNKASSSKRLESATTLAGRENTGVREILSRSVKQRDRPVYY